AEDDEEAVKWYRKAAEQGNNIAQSELAIAYKNGQGVIQDYVKAHKWWNIAAALGNKDAIRNRGVVAKKMTVKQLAKAQELAAEWMEKHP
ncbi:uncharacterized protein METZ01_LOCUS440057, partial [marine metagenome]